MKITEKVLESIKTDTIFSYGFDFRNKNFATSHRYKGFSNNMMMFIARHSNGFKTPNWIGMNQARTLGISIIKGSIGTPVLIPIIKENIDGEDIMVGSRQSTVFNLDQTDYDIESVNSNFGTGDFSKIQEIIDNYICTEGICVNVSDHNSYNPEHDVVNIVHKSNFTRESAYYEAFVHELMHSTMKDTRLGRKFDYKDEQSRIEEEVVAELATAWLFSEYNIPIDNCSQYIKGYIGDNVKLLMDCVQKSELAVNYIRRTNGTI